MKRDSLFRRLMLPALFILLVFPLLAGLSFGVLAQRYAEAQAAENLVRLEEVVSPYVNEILEEDSALSPREKVGSFVRNAAPAVRRIDGMEGNGRILLFAAAGKLVYPREEADQAAVAPLTEACRRYIKENGQDGFGKTVQLKTDEGKTYLTRILHLQNGTREMQYLVTYCPISDIGLWVKAAEHTVLLISFAAALILAALFFYHARTISRMLERLCRETERIGQGRFAHIDTQFDIAELETLRSAMNRMAEKLRHAESAKQHFYQNISHDLRTPLMSIAGYAQGIETGVFEDPVHAAHIISEESIRLTGLIEGLLNLSRIESRENLQRKPIALDSFLREIYERMNGLALSRGIEIRLSGTENLPAVLGDEEALEQILENLLSNALRYAHQKIQIRATYEEAPRDGAEQGWVRLEMQDDGDGIREEELPHLFERHYKGAEGCFGFGLAIAHAAAENIGAMLSAENSDEGGACFTLRLQVLPTAS